MRAALYPVLTVMALGLIVGCEGKSGVNSPSQRTALQRSSKDALSKMEAQDPGLRNVVDNAYAYAIFPDVGQGAAGIGAAGGHGVIYRNGHMVATAEMNQVSVGLQLGGDTYSELIIFQNQPALAVMENGNLEFGADASASIVKAGAAAKGQFNNGTQVYVLPTGGLMAGVAITGQKFTYHPMQNNNMNDNNNNQ